MKCYFTLDKLRGTKVLIPMCYGSLHQTDLSCCECADTPLTYAGFEKKAFNEKVEVLNKEIEELRATVDILKADNYALMRVLEQLHKRKKQR